MTRFVALGSAIMLVASLVTPAFATDAMPGTVGTGGGVATKLATLRPNTFVWYDQGVRDDQGVREDQGETQPVSIVISIPDQKAYVYRGETMVAASSVSTGKDGKDTPIGTFPILQKEEMHRSNLYDSAPMPFMQRLTWDGVAIHAGRNPGFPASHGCVRVPRGFAEKLFAVTTLGTQVMVTDASASEGFVPPRPHDPAMMAAAIAAANAAGFDEVMSTMNR